MKDICVDRVYELAVRWEELGKSWHFHVLTPGCILNERDDKYALILENRTDDQTWAVYSDQEHAKLSQALVKILHSDTILDKGAQAESSTNPDLAHVLERINELNETACPWHHHMLFPDCIFNEHPGIWTIVLEDEQRGKIVQLLSDTEPVDDLRQIEIRYFEHSDPGVRDAEGRDTGEI